MQARHIEVVISTSPEDGEAFVISDAGLNTILIDWSFRDDNAETHTKARKLLERVRSRYARIPVFLMAERDEVNTIPLEVTQLADEFIWTLEDTAPFIAGRVLASILRDRELVWGPMTSALFKFAGTFEYSWHTRFLRLLWREPVALGSIHQRRGIKIVLCGRNCHKSIEHGLIPTGGIPVYLMPSRNCYGIIGPMAAVAANPVATLAHDQKPAHCVITNSTYDGLCSKVTRITELLHAVVGRIHFDEA